MGAVYLARDLKHDRPVALKVLLPELTSSVGPDRFQREIKLAARLQHPHILTVHDSGETAGQLWFTMPYVEGESLRDRLRRDRQLPLEEALRITREAAQALQYAHDHGVVHRDIKPENLLLTRDGSTLVADFGIARTVEGDEHVTKTGISLGTPAYMSPEQASAEQTVDARSDVYSLGAVLYEMLAGEPPYTGSSLVAIVTKWLTGPVPSVRAVRPEVPESVDQSIQRALAQSAEDRLPTMAEFVRMLQGAPSGYPPLATPAITPVAAAAGRRRVPAAVVALALGALLAGAFLAWRHAREESRTRPKVLAVLPFENLGDSADAYFADGATEAVRGKLSRVAGLEVIARGSCNQYRRTTKAPQEIARDLGADYLLTATVRWDKAAGRPSRVRVTPELVDASSGHAPRTLWQEPFDAALTDVFQVQADIAGKVVGALDVALGDSARQELATKPTANLAAYDAFLKGEAASQDMAAVDPPSLRRAIAFYQQAVALDSMFVPAWAQLARAQAILYGNSSPTPEVAAQARLAAERAQAVGPGRPEGQLALCVYYRQVQLDSRQALAACEAGLKLAPNNIALLSNTAASEQSLGRWEASVEPLRRGAALDPRSPSASRRLASTFLYLRRYPEARSAIDRALTLAPANVYSIELKAMIALAQGDLAGAKAVVQTGIGAVEAASLVAFFGTYEDLYWVLDDAQQQQLLTLPVSYFDDDRGNWALVRAETHALRGNQGLARAYADSARLTYEEQLRATPNDGQRHVLRGLMLAYLGRKAEAIQAGERAAELWPISRDANQGAYIQHQVVRIYLLVGEPEQALDRLEPLLKQPYYLSPGWLRVDPSFAPLKGNPRFERLVAEKQAS